MTSPATTYSRAAVRTDALPPLRTYAASIAGGGEICRIEARSHAAAAMIYADEMIPSDATRKKLYNHLSCSSVRWTDDGARHHVFITEVR